MRRSQPEPWACVLLGLALGASSRSLAQDMPAAPASQPAQAAEDPGPSQPDPQGQARPVQADRTDPAAPGQSPPAAPPQTPDEGSSAAEHVAPEPPQHPLPVTTQADMIRMMEMNDAAPFGQILLDQAEWRHSGNEDAGAWDAQGYYGGDYDKLWVKTEGEREDGETEDAHVDVLWDRIVTRWWSLQAGAREDFGGPGRTWAAIGLQGIAPGWFDVEGTFYVGGQGRTAARVKTEYDLLLTQRLILQPEVEVNLYGKSDPARQVGSGLSDLDAGIRLRYEIRRELAPYIGIAWTQQFGATADLVRAAGLKASERQLVVGIRAWL